MADARSSGRVDARPKALQSSGMSSPALLRDADASDAADLAALYNHYILETTFNLEETALAPGAMQARIDASYAAGLPWLVLRDPSRLLGFACAGAWKARSGYRHTVEVSVYLAPDAHGIGHGSRLFDALLRRLPGAGVHAAIAGITLPNPASIALHETFGFRKIGHFSDVGRKFGRWIDVGYWQRLLA